MATETIAVDSVLSQFSALSTKDQQKFAAEMARFLQGQPKKSGAKRSVKAAKDAESSEEEKPKRERSEKQKADFALKTAVREAILAHTKAEKLSQSIVFPIAGRLKELGNMEPTAEQVVALYNEYLATPWLCKGSKKKDTGSVSDKASVAASEAEEKPVVKAEAPKKVAKKVVAPPPPPPPAEEDEEEVTEFETEAWTHEGKAYMRHKKAPLYCWDLKTSEYKGVWIPERKAFNTDIPDPLEESEE